MAEQPPHEPEPPEDETVILDGAGDETVVDNEWAVAPERRVAVEQTEVVEEEPPRRRLPELWPWLLALLLLVLAGLAAAYFLTRDDGNGAATTTTAAAQAQVPVLVGLKRDRAVDRIEQAGFEAKLEEKESAKPKDVVFAQDPEAGTDLAKGETVTISVSTGPPKEQVPDVVGQPVDEAVAALEDAGLQSKQVQEFGDGEEGTVLKQDPAGGSELKQDAVVTLTVSKGPQPASVPDVVGLKSSDATAQLREAGFDVRLVTVPSDQPAGTVVAQSPGGGEEAAKGSTVRLNVAQQSGGGGGGTTTQAQERTTVPDAEGKELAEAASEFADAGLKVAVAYVPSDERRGTVVAQAQDAGSEANRGDTVQLNVALGSDPGDPASVPDVTGEALKDARKTLADAGYEVRPLRIDGGELKNSSPVASQSPDGGASLPPGVLVLLYLG